MRTKKYFFVFLILSFVLSTALLMTACNNKDSVHTHSFSMWQVTTKSTCVSEGVQSRICATCGYVEYSSIQKTGHTPIEDRAVAATCTTDGKTAGSHCAVCGEILVAQTVIAKTGHTPIEDKSVAATCTTDGKTAGSHCTICGEILVAQTIVSKTGHKYDEGKILKKATCLNQGIVEYSCTVKDCNYTYTEPYSMPTYSATELYNFAVKFVGEIVVYDKKGVEISLATGFVYSSDGKIITNYHVIENAYSAKITINGVSYSITKVLAYDENIDLAVLKINANGLDYANVCKESVNTGDTVYAIGSSRGLTNTFSQGIITQANRTVNGVTYIQHDASITHGNSGGPLLNVYGEVIGINAWGISDSQNLNFAVFTSELDNLVYGNEITLTEFYELNNTPYDILLDWLTENYNATGTTQIRFDYKTDSDWYSIVYDTEYEYIYIDVFSTFSNGSELYIFIDLSCDSFEYDYYANYSLDENENKIYGSIAAISFTKNTALKYDSYSGTYWEEDSLMNFYRVCVVDLLDWFNLTIKYYDVGIDITDFGFVAFENVNDESTAMAVLVDHIENCGTYDSTTQWYKISDVYSYTDFDCYFNLVYNKKDDRVFASMSWFFDDGAWFYCYLSLTPYSYGNYYACSYSVRENGSYDKKNNTWGYLNPATFTSSTTLPYESYDGCDDDLDELLKIYVVAISDVLDYLSEYFKTEQIGITIGNLGFTSYK